MRDSVLTLDRGAAHAILAAAMAVAVRVSSRATGVAVAARCPDRAITHVGPGGSPALPAGTPVHPYQGKQF